MALLCLLSSVFSQSTIPPSPRPPVSPSLEYLWYEAENMRGFSTGKLGEPLLNPSHVNPSRDKAPGWGINGPGVSAEWSQGGESEWNSAAASADETKATIHQDLEIPRAGQYTFWIRYADWANKNESFTVGIAQNNAIVFKHEFGSKDVIDPHDEVSLYWQWAFAWDSASTTLKKGPARVVIEIDKAAEARRHVDCFVITNDSAYRPSGRQKPDFAAMRHLREWNRKPLSTLISTPATENVPSTWIRPRVAGRDFFMPWNINTAFWGMYDKPTDQRPLYPFHTELVDAFVEKYKGARDVPIFQSKLIVPVIYINNLPEYLKEGSAFLRYLRETKSPFVVLINYGSASMPEADAQAAWKMLSGEFKDQFLGWVSGESIGFVWDSAPTELKITPAMSRQELLEAHRNFYTNALARKWQTTFHTQTGPMWDKLLPAQSTSSTSFAHPLSEWGVKLLGMETAAVQPMTAMRIAFTRGAARQFGGAFFYYHAPNFGDTATTFTNTQNFGGPDFFLHSRYGPSMGPSLSWYRKSYYLYYMSGASAIYLEQGFDQFFKPGPGQHPLQLNPLGRITEEFMRFAEKHPERGTPYTPIAFLLDPAHGFEMTDYPHWPFEVSQINKSDRALRELFGVAYYPGLVVEGEPAIADRQPFVAGVFGDIFDVLVATPTIKDAVDRETLNEAIRLTPSSPPIVRPLRVTPFPPVDAYKAVVIGGQPDLTDAWANRLVDYVHGGGTIVVNAAQRKHFSEALLGVRFTNEFAEADSARCLAPAEVGIDLTGQMFRYEKIQLNSAKALITAPNGDPLVTVNKSEEGTVVFSALPDLLGEDERMTPFAAHMLAHVFSDATPVQVRGDVEYLINRTSNSWIITLLNNNGVFKPQQGLAQVDRNAYVTANISLRGQAIQSAVDWITDKAVDVQRGSNQLSVRIAPGGVAVIEIRTRP
jgi:hypothetical protein